LPTDDLAPYSSCQLYVINSHTNTSDYLELWDVSKTLAAAAPVTALASNSTCGITTGSGRHVDVSGSFPAEFAPGLKFRLVLAERTMTNFASFEGHNLEVDVFNPAAQDPARPCPEAGTCGRSPGVPG